MMNNDNPAKVIAAVGDIHVRETDRGKWTAFFKEVSEQADVLVLAGDLTDTGDETEAQVLVDELRGCSIPVVAVLGNHDYEKDRQKLIRQTLVQAGVHMLDGEAIVINDIGFAGGKGFGGGFDKHMLTMFGENAMKAFVQETVNESLALDRALARLDQEHVGIPKVVVLHYSPMQATVAGEPESIYPFLGSSRLAEPINRHQVVVAFHGHAHAGTLRGELPGGTPVFNVARPVLLKSDVSVGYYLFEVPQQVPAATGIN